MNVNETRMTRKFMVITRCAADKKPRLITNHYTLRRRQKVFKITTRKKFILMSHFSSNNALFRPSGSYFATQAREKAGDFLHTNTHSVQFFGIFGAFFCLDSPFCKHTKFSKGNAKFFCGVDFFQPPAAFFLQNKRKRLYSSRLAKSLKIRFFSTKKFLAQNS